MDKLIYVFIPIIIFLLHQYYRFWSIKNNCKESLNWIYPNIQKEGTFKCEYHSHGGRTIGHDAKKCKFIITKKEVMIIFLVDSFFSNSISKPLFFSNNKEIVKGLKNVKKVIPIKFKKGIFHNSIFIEFDEKNLLSTSVNVTIFDVPSEMIEKSIDIFENVV
jgi:hypothetical protein